MDTTVTSGDFLIRSLTQEDDKAVRYLLEAYPEPGLVSTVMQMRSELVGQAFNLIRPGSYSLGAFLPEDNTNTHLVGVIYGWPHQIQVKGQLYPALLIYGLVVQPEYRNLELGVLLRRKLLNWSAQNFDKNKLVVYAYTQKPGPDEQLKATNRHLALTPVKTLSGVRVGSGCQVKVREASQADLTIIVQGLNEFYRDYAFYSPQTHAGLSDWLTPKKLDGIELPLAKYYVIPDESGSIQAGLGIFNTTLLYDVQVTQVPTPVRLLNKILKVIPEDGFLKLLQVSRIWYSAGQLPLARKLWGEVRAIENTRGSSLVVSFDPGTPLKDLFNLPFTHLTSKMSLIVHQAPAELDFSKSLLAPYES